MNTMDAHFDKVFAAMRTLEKRMHEMNDYHGPKQSGAVRRASMDLTRTLAEMRSGK